MRTATQVPVNRRTEEPVGRGKFSRVHAFFASQLSFLHHKNTHILNCSLSKLIRDRLSVFLKLFFLRCSLSL